MNYDESHPRWQQFIRWCSGRLCTECKYFDGESIKTCFRLWLEDNKKGK